MASMRMMMVRMSSFFIITCTDRRSFLGLTFSCRGVAGVPSPLRLLLFLPWFWVPVRGYRSAEGWHTFRAYSAAMAR